MTREQIVELLKRTSRDVHDEWDCPCPSKMNTALVVAILSAIDIAGLEIVSRDPQKESYVRGEMRWGDEGTRRKR